MSWIDPYSPPKAPVVHAEKKPSLSWKEYAVMAFVVLQVILSIRFAVAMSKLSSTEVFGALGVAFILSTALCVGIMIFGGILTLRRGRSPTYIFVFASVLSFLLMLQWQQSFSTVCAIVALCTSVLSALNMGSDDNDVPSPPRG